MQEIHDQGKPDTILIELGDSTTIMIISESNEEFAGLKKLSLDTVINALMEVMEMDEFQDISDSLIEFELAHRDFEEALRSQELAARIQKDFFEKNEKVLEEFEKARQLYHIKELDRLEELEEIKELENLHELENRERLKDLEKLREFEELNDFHDDGTESKKDQLMISTNVGVGLIRDNISPTADFILAFAIKKYYYALIGNMNFTFEQKADNSYRTLNNIFLGVEFGRRFSKKESEIGFSTYFNNVGLSYLVQKQENYFGDNTLKLYYGIDAGPVIIQPQLIATDNFEDWFPSIGLRIRL